MKKFLFNTTAFFAPVDPAREALRKSIQVTHVKGEGKDGEGEEETVEEVVEEVVAEGEGENHQETIDENKEEIKANEKTAEELAAELEAATTEKDRARVQKRIDRLTAKNDNLIKENEELKKQLAAKPKEGLTEEEVERRSNVKADQKAAERQFATDCNKLFADASKVDKEFKKKIDGAVADLGGLDKGGIPPIMIGYLSDIDNGGAVLAHLANDVDLYEEVRELPMTKMANRLNKIGLQLEKAAEEAAKAAKKAPKEPSRVPNPVQPIRGNQSSPDSYTKTMSMDSYVEMRNRQKAALAERRKAGLRD